MSSVPHHAFSVIAPGSTIGILGGGQLGRMLAIAAAGMGYRTHIFTPEKDAPASHVALQTTCASFEDTEALQRFAQTVDILTYEFENIPVDPLQSLARLAPIRPNLEVLSVSQHRVREKETMNKLGIETAPFAAVTCEADVHFAAERLGLPAVLKTCTMGYDGKGQAKIIKSEDITKAWQELQTTDAIVEGWVDFRMEISVIVARDIYGNTKCYPPVHNVHKNHILSETHVPAPLTPDIAKKAEVIAQTIAQGINLIGLMAVEMFVLQNDELLVNEIAPRPHNSGHWTMDACTTSQFEQTIRAICGLPLGNTDCLTSARMLNLIGDEWNDWQKYLEMPNAKLHLYGKKESRPGRKMGHVTFLEN